MTRSDKIRKLANAILEYRGLYRQTGGVWIYPANPAKLANVRLWLQRLGRSMVDADVIQINNFKTLGEFDQWIRSL